MNKDLGAAVIDALKRHEAAIQSMRVLGFALIQTHHNHQKLLEKFLDGMDVVADSVAPDSLSAYREELVIFEKLMLDLIQASQK